MTAGTIYSSIVNSTKKNKKQFALLIDPDKFESEKNITLAEQAEVDFILVGGSIITNGNFSKCIEIIKKNTKIPVLIFPGNVYQVNKNADAILLLSLISGRNADLLIGNQVLAAPMLQKSKLEILPTGYMIIESGKQTAASYMSNTQPIPSDKSDIAMCTAMAGEMLGLKLIYLDGGSGAEKTIEEKMVMRVKQNISIPLIVGGGINNAKQAFKLCEAGADVIVVGNAIEKNPSLIKNISKEIHKI